MAARASHRADPECVVLGLGGLVPPNNPKYMYSHPNSSWEGYKPFVEKVLDRAGIDNIDGISIHGYLSGLPEEGWWPLSERLEYFRMEMKKRGRILPIWDTESGAVCGLFYTDRVDGADNFWNRDTGGRLLAA